jgi:hypothetical protein
MTANKLLIIDTDIPDIEIFKAAIRPDIDDYRHALDRGYHMGIIDVMSFQ